MKKFWMISGMLILLATLSILAIACGGEDEEKDEEEQACTVEADCGFGNRCINGTCASKSCTIDADCVGDEICVIKEGLSSGLCTPDESEDGDISLCEEGEKRCSGDTVEACNANGSWAYERECTKGCENGVCGEDFDPVGECELGDVRCNDNLVEICKNVNDVPIWQFYQECPFGCEEGHCIGADGDEEVVLVCEENEKKCYDNQVMVCSDDGQSWTVEDPCINGTCIGEPPLAQCGDKIICQPRMRVCNEDDTAVKVCNEDGTEWDLLWCSGMTCDRGQCVSDSFCKPGKYRCNGNVVEICDQGGEMWMPSDTCTENELCTCYNYVGDSCIQAGCDGQAICQGWVDFRCNGDKLERCSYDGKSWALSKNCESDDQVCVDNGSGEASCEDPIK